MIPTVFTRYIALLGQPLGFSMASVMQNAALRACGLDALYFPLECQQDDLTVLLDAFRRMPFLGLAVTKPFKIKILDYLDCIDPIAERIGSCNTVRMEAGCLNGINTDGDGFADALYDVFEEFHGKSMLVCGAGGTARALSFACASRGMGQIGICNRSLDKANRLAWELKQFGANACSFPIEEIPDVLRQFDILVNATGLGMQPYEGQSPISAEALFPQLFVCDLAYNPSRTKLLEDAEKKGCRVMNGFAMAVYQGVRQFEFLTGKEAPVSIMEAALRGQGD